MIWVDKEVAGLPSELLQNGIVQNQKSEPLKWIATVGEINTKSVRLAALLKMLILSLNIQNPRAVTALHGDGMIMGYGWTKAVGLLSALL